MADDVHMNGLEFEIKGSADKAAKGVDNLRTSLKGLKTVAKGGTGLDKAAKEAKDFGDAVAESSTTAQQSVTGMNAAGKAATSLGQKFASLKTKVSEAFTDAAKTKALHTSIDSARQKVSDFGSAIMQSKSAWTALAGEADKFLEPLKTAGATVMQPIVGAMRTIGTVGVDSFNSIVKGIEKGVTTGNVFKGVLTGVTGVLGTLLKAAASVAVSIGKVLVGAFSKLVSVVKNTIKSIVQFPRKIKESITNGIENLRNKITEIGQAAKKWFNNSVFTKPLRNAAQVAGVFANKLSHLGNSLKRVLFYRVVRTVIKEIGDAFKTGVNNLYAWSAAIGGEFASSMDRMATSMLYFKNSIGAMAAPLFNVLAPALDFVIDKVVDLLNVINQLFARLTGATYWTRAIKQASNYSDAARSAGGAAKEAMRYLAPFDELNVLPDDKNRGGGGGSGGNAGGGMFEEMVEFNNEIKDFADRLKAAFNAGDWEGVGDVISEKLNDIIENRIPWESIGQKFGYWVNAIVSMEYWTLEKTNFDSLGKGIADFINSTINEIDFKTWGRLITNKLTAALDFAIGLFTNLDTESIGKSIKDFFVGMFDEWSDWFNKYDWSDLGTILYEKVKGLFTGLKFSEIASSFFTMLGNALGSATQFLGTFFGNIGADIKAWFDENLRGEDWASTARNILNWIATGFSNLAAWVDTNFITPFMNALGVGDAWANVKTVGSNVMEKIRVGWPTLKAWVSSNVIEPMSGALKTGEWSEVSSTGSTVMQTIQKSWPVLKNWVVENVTDPIGTALLGEENWKSVKTAFGNLPQIFSEAIGSLKEWAMTNIVDPIWEAISTYPWGELFSSLAAEARYAIEKEIYGEDKAAVRRYKRENPDVDVGSVWNPLTGNTTWRIFDENGKIIENNLTADWFKEQVDVDFVGVLKDIKDEVPEEKKSLDGIAAKIKKAQESADYEKPDLRANADIAESDIYFASGGGRRNLARYQMPIIARADIASATDNISASDKVTRGWTAQQNYMSRKWTGYTLSHLVTSGWTAAHEYISRKWKNPNTTTTGWTATHEYMSRRWKNPNTTTTGWTAEQNYIKDAIPYANRYITNLGAGITAAYNAMSSSNGAHGWISGIGSGIAAVYNEIDKDQYGARGWLSGFGAKVTTYNDSIQGSKVLYGFAAKVTAVTKALGGVYSGGSWKPIQAYASGGKPSGGQLFVAREAGPELVGTLKGHTAVMNNDQIVASVSAGVARAISNIQFHMTGLGSFSVPTYDQGEETEEMMYRAFVRALAETDFSSDDEITVNLDGEPVYRNVVKRNRNNTKLTGINAMA